MSEYSESLSEFIEASPSSYHAAAEVARILESAGFEAVDERDAWPTRAGGFFVVRDGAIVAWRMPASATAATPYRILGSHTDSPGLKLKPKPAFTASGWMQAGVEVYGGALLNSWLDRDLEFAGRITTADGVTRLVRSGPVFRVPQLAIHLDREVNSGLTLDRQRNLQPVLGVLSDRTAAAPAAGSAPNDDPVLAVFAERAGVATSEIVGHDLLSVDAQAPALIGVDGTLFAAKRLDNLSSVFAGLTALLALGDDELGTISVLACFDHEEIGSESRSGASGPFLSDVLERIGGAVGASTEDRLRAFASSWCLSADAGHSVHPNYAQKHDPNVTPVAGKGPLLKINANQRYVTDARGAALWHRVCAEAGVTYQQFVSNNDVPCGSTIGPLTATRLGIATLDVGVPLLSMHSARELAHVDDLESLSLAAASFFRAQV